MRRIVAIVTFYLVLAILSGPTANAQCSVTTQGRDFWCMFLRNYNERVTLSLVATGAQGTVVYVENPRTGFYSTRAIDTTGVLRISLDFNNAQSSFNAQVEDRGIHITATADISLYALNFMNNSYDATVIFPTASLGTEYMAQTYPQRTTAPSETGGGSEVGFVATEDNTVLTYTLPCDMLRMNGTVIDSTGSARTVTLQHGQTYQIRTRQFGSFSGMRVSSNGKPFGMFQGTTCALVPDTSCEACDHLYEQTLPLKAWGRKHVIVPTAFHVGDKILITSSADSNIISWNGIEQGLLMEGQTWELEAPAEPATMLESSAPVSVGIYIMGQDCAGGMGDPAAVMLPPVEQGIQQVRFNANSTASTSHHYVNIVTRTVDTAGMQLDGQHIGGNFYTVPAFPSYSYSKLSVTAGQHVLSNDHGRFVAFFYGLGNYESYAYIAGMATHNLDNRLYVNGMDVLDYMDSINVCGNDTVEFSLHRMDTTLSVEWWVDGELVGEGMVDIYRTFPNGSWHRVDAVLNDICDTLSAFVYAHPYQHDTLPVEICTGGTYYFDTLQLDTAGEYSAVYPDIYGCDSVSTVALSVIDTAYTEQIDTFCFDAVYDWNGRELSEEGLYLDTVMSPMGNCETFVGLRLTKLKKPVEGIDTTVHCAEGTYTLGVLFADDALPEEPLGWRWGASPYDDWINGHEGDTTLIVHPESAVDYSLQVDYRCPFTEHITLAPVNEVQAQMVVNPEVLTTDDLTFVAYDISRNTNGRVWYVNDNIVADASSTLHYEVSSYSDSVRLVLQVFANGCSDSTSRVLPIRHVMIWTPNVFIPSDENNSRFVILCRDIEPVELTIYNRDGLQVYKSTQMAPGWDGTHGGVPCPQGTYVWHLVYKSILFPDTPQTKVGTITLIR